MENNAPSTPDSFLYADSAATIMLRSALDRYTAAPGKSLRKLGIELGYKNAVILSHMSLGRVPIPLDRADEFARVLDMNAAEFVAKVLLQRHPNAYQALQLAPAPSATQGFPIPPQTSEHERIALEVLRDFRPQQRWLTIPECLAVERIRNAKPTFSTEGLTNDELERVVGALQN